MNETTTTAPAVAVATETTTAPAPEQQPKLDPIAAAAKAEELKAAAAAAYASALGDCQTSAKLAAEAAGELLLRGRNQTADLGMIFQTHFDTVLASGLIPWDNARNMLTAAVALETGESLDIGRPMAVNAAAEFFGRTAFVSLPVDSQHAFGALFSLTNCLGDDGKETGKKAYTLTGLGHNDAIRAFTFATGHDKLGLQKFLPGARFARAGYLHQEDCRSMIAVIGRAARSADKKTVIDDVSAAPEKLVTVAKAAIAEKEAAKTERSERREKIKGLLSADAKGEAVPAAAAALPTANLPPHGRAVGIAEALKDVPTCDAFAKIAENDLFASIFAGFSEAGRLADLQAIAKRLEAEIAIARKIADEGGPAKCNRVKARAMLRAEREKAGSAKKVA